MSFHALQSKLAAISTDDEVLKLQIRIVSIFLQSEDDCRANARAFHAFAIKVWDWASEVQCADDIALAAFRQFVKDWMAFVFL